MLSTQHTKALLSRIRHAEEPAIAFKVGGLDALAAMDKVQSHDETTQDSGSGSGYSDLSALENETDEFGRRLLQHQRDVQCLNNAIGPGQQAFRRARPRPRLADRLEQEQRRDAMVDGGAHERRGSGGSNGSEPPLNLPRQWGTKAKRRSDWLRKLRAPTETEVPLANVEPEQGERRRDEDAIMPHRTAYTGDDEDWVAVADESTASIETTTPSMRRHRPDSSPTSMCHMNTEILETEDGDFTAASLLASTPAVNRRNRRIDDLTRREIASIEKRGVATRTLEQIFEQSTSTTTTATTNLQPRSLTEPSDSTTTAARAPRRRRSLIANKENLPPNGDMNGHGYGHYKGVETVGLVNRTAEAVTFKNAQRPAHKRTDSYNLLKRLARVSSLSPSPGKSRAEGDSMEKLARDEEVEGGKVMSGGREARPHSSAGHFATPADAEAIAEADGDQADALPNVRVEAPDIDVTPAPQDPAPQDAKTPVVTGAWLDTPGPGIDVRPLLQSTDSTIVRAFGSPSAIATLEPRQDPMDEDLEPRRVFSEPVHGKSALADVLKDVKDHRADDVQLGETTIQSLEDIVTPDMDPTDTTMTLDVGGVAREAVDAIDDAVEAGVDERPRTQAQKDRRQEKLAMEAMNKHLRAARTSIKDANRGLRRVENRIETAQQTTETPLTSPLPNSATSSTPPPLPAHGRDKHSSRCPTCGYSTRSAIRTLVSNFASCFYTRYPADPSRHRLTWLGLTCVTWLLWLLLESTLCALYCHPHYASRMEGYGVDPRAPRWPFVLPTLIFRPTRFVWGPAWDALVLGVNGVVENFFGAGDITAPVGLGPSGIGGRSYGGVAGNVPGTKAFTGRGTGGSGGSGSGTGTGWVRTTTATLVSASARVASSVVEAVDEVGSMWDDEFVT